MNGHVKVLAASACAVLAVGAVTPVRAQGARPLTAAGTARAFRPMSAAAGTAAGAAGLGGPGGPGQPGGLHISGTVSSVSSSADTITITPTGSTAPEVITLTSGTILVGHETIPASAIAVGDTLLISGIPLAVQATSIVDAKTAAASSSSSSASTSGVSAGEGGATNVAALKPVPGVVTALSPLTVEVNGEFSVTVTGTGSTTISEELPVTLSELAAGDTVSAQVIPSSGGTLTAVRVDVTAQS